MENELEVVSLEKELVDNLKEMGLEVAEEVAVKLIEVVLNYAEKKVIESETKVDDLFLAVLPLIKKQLIDLASDIKKEEV